MIHDAIERCIGLVSSQKIMKHNNGGNGCYPDSYPNPGRPLSLNSLVLLYRDLHVSAW